MEDPVVDSGTAFSVVADASGVVSLVWASGLQIDQDLAASAMAAVNELNGERQRPLYVDMTGTAVLTREARKVFTRPCSASRVALVGRSAVDRVLANFALGVTPIPSPTRFFTSEQAALDWLRNGG